MVVQVVHCSSLRAPVTHMVQDVLQCTDLGCSSSAKRAQLGYLKPYLQMKKPNPD